MAKKQYYGLVKGYTRVIKQDITDGIVVYLRKDVANGISSPYGYNILGRTGRIGIREIPAKKASDLHRWYYCADLCKKIIN